MFLVSKALIIHSFCERTPPFPVHVLEDVEEVNFQICTGGESLDEEQRAVILQTNDFHQRLQIHLYVKLLQKVDWKSF